jgi:hypothetical protein
MNCRAACQKLIAVTAILSFGCNQNAVPVSDTDAAKALLETSLSAWKDGKSVADMRSLTPPVYASEELWNTDLKLSNFVIDGDGELYGTSVKFRVTLEGTDKDGGNVSKQFEYLVTTTPALTIARSDR